jgi:hypothetical protein
VSEWSGIMCQEWSNEQSGWLVIRIMCQEWSRIMCQWRDEQSQVGWESG